MEQLIDSVPWVVVIIGVAASWFWVLSWIISVSESAKSLLAELQKTNAILTAVHGLDGATAQCSACRARITIPAERIGHATRCPACRKVARSEPLPAAR